MMRFAWLLVLLAACGDGRSSSRPSGTCGNGQIDGDEVCDGADLGGVTCESIQAGAGTLVCTSNCGGYNLAGSSGSCTPDCGQRVCGPDPRCGVSCGTCGPGRCEAGACVGDGGGSAPRILSLNVNSNNLTPGDDLVVTAIVTDPDGIDDLIGGELVHPAGGSYGAFATAAQEGSYTLTLTWAQLDAVVPIRGDAQRIDQHVRTLQARFFDVAGHMVTQEVSVTFSCDVAGRGLCGTGCADFQTNPFHCGECGRRCDSFGGNYYGDATGNFCQEGLCNVVRSTDASDSRSCDQICADVGLQCEPSFQSWANVQNCARQGVGCTGRFVPEGQFCEFQGMSCGCRG